MTMSWERMGHKAQTQDHVPINRPGPFARASKSGLRPVSQFHMKGEIKSVLHHEEDLI